MDRCVRVDGGGRRVVPEEEAWRFEDPHMWGSRYRCPSCRGAPLYVLDAYTPSEAPFHVLGNEWWVRAMLRRYMPAFVYEVPGDWYAWLDARVTELIKGDPTDSDSVVFERFAGAEFKFRIRQWTTVVRTTVVLAAGNGNPGDEGDMR